MKLFVFDFDGTLVDTGASRIVDTMSELRDYLFEAIEPSSRQLQAP
jgi:beta-phosphoglucomutase-like phosphatase (HAD superfamily)